MNESPDREAEGTPERLERSKQRVESVRQPGLDAPAAKQECVSCYARPDEREDVGRRIDPDTANVFFIYAQVIDPYGDGGVPEEVDRVAACTSPSIL